MQNNNSSIMIQAIFLDVDGTLVSFKGHSVPESCVQALSIAHNSGCKIVIATGRAVSDLHELERIPYDAVIALNGTDCELCDGTRIFGAPISTDDFYKALKLSEEFDFPLAIENNNGIMVNKLNQTVIDLANFVNHPIPRVVDLENEFRKGECFQLCFYCDIETEQQVLSKIPNLAASRWYPIFADINAKGINKATGIEKICDFYGIDIKQTMSFGDGGNDIPMLKICGIGVAMEGASDEVKASADYVTNDVDDDGIYNALVHFNVIQESNQADK